MDYFDNYMQIVIALKETSQLRKLLYSVSMVWFTKLIPSYLSLANCTSIDNPVDFSYCGVSVTLQHLAMVQSMGLPPLQPM